nr:ABC transporter ATP-binding protein [Dehalobacterium formicoaceticum]
MQLIKYLKPYWKTALAAPLVMMVEVVSELLLPLLMARIVDQGIALGNIPLIVQTGLMMIAVTIVGMLGGFGCSAFSSISAQNFGADLRVHVFRKVQSFSFAELDYFDTSSLITRLTNDAGQVQTFVMMLLRVMIKAPLLFTGGIIMAILVNPGLSKILLGSIPFLALILFYVIRKGIPLYTAVQKALDRVNAVVRENLAGIRVVKAFVRGNFEKQRFNQSNQQLIDSGVRAARVMGLIMPSVTLIINLSVLAVIWFGGIRVNRGNMQVGEVMAFINYMTQIMFSLMMAGFMLMMTSRAKVSGDRIQEVLSREPSIQDSQNAAEAPIRAGRIDFEKVDFRYPQGSGAPVLKDLTFTAFPGERVAILGSTGSGKSTLINLISRFYDVSSGRVLVDGRDVRDIPLEVLRHGIGLVDQKSLLFSGTVWENIRWGKGEASNDEVIAAAQMAQAHDFILALPDGYDTLLGQRGVNLSGGQKQRIAIARAIIRKAPILILDDSTSAVDAATEQLIRNGMKEGLPGTTFLIIAQRISSVMDADKILVLEDGELVASGSHDELLACCPVYQDIYDSQMGGEEITHE